MDVIFFIEISVDFQWTTQRCIPDDITVHSDRCENLKYNVDICIHAASSVVLGGSPIRM
jgi:hypothetical protein